MNKKNKIILDIILKSNTFYGKIFDLIIILIISLNTLIVMLESIENINLKYHYYIIIFEIIITIIFTIEYLLRIYYTKDKWKYIFSFYGIIDLISIIPLYLGLFIYESKYISNIRILRLIRIFRIINSKRFTKVYNNIIYAFKKSKDKIIVFVSFILLIMIIIGTIMYIVEHNDPNSKFTNIPISIYWTIVTLTTVGYGDISPVTPMGKLLASLVMIIGYGIIAVPTSILSMGIKNKNKYFHVCTGCKNKIKFKDSLFCNKCGQKIIKNLNND